MSNPRGFLLLALPNAHIKGPTIEEKGPLYLECISLDVPDASGDTTGSGKDAQRDVWLVVRVGSHEMPVSAVHAINYSRLRNEYTFTDPDHNTSTVLTLENASDPSTTEDLETLQVLLEQYGVLHFLDGQSYADEKRGRLVLVDEADGHLVGNLDFTDVPHSRFREDLNFEEEGREKDPVIVDFPERDDGDVVVKSLRAEEGDNISNMTNMLSRGILLATNAISGGMNTAADYYISKAKPNEKPLVFSEGTKGNLKRVHHISGRAVVVSSKTTKMIHDQIDSWINKAAAPKGKEKATASNSPQKKPRLLNRLLMSTDLLLTTLEQSAKTLIESGTSNISRSLDHKYGKDAGGAAIAIGGTVKNVGVVYIDARGVGRRALIRRAGKRVVKARLGGNKEVVFGTPVAETNERSGPSNPSLKVSNNCKPPLPSRSPVSSPLLEKPPLPPRGRSQSPSSSPLLEKPPLPPRRTPSPTIDGQRNMPGGFK